MHVINQMILRNIIYKSKFKILRSGYLEARGNCVWCQKGSWMRGQLVITVPAVNSVYFAVYHLKYLARLSGLPTFKSPARWLKTQNVRMQNVQEQSSTARFTNIVQ